MRFKTKEMIYASLFAALIAVLSYVKIPLPFSPVPITGQSVAVMLAGSILNPITAGGSLLIFILLGAFGLPVFAGGTGGMQVILGPTGGYLFGYALAAFIMAKILTGTKRNIKKLLLVNLLGAIIIYGCGVPQLSLVTGMNFKQAIAAGVLPYIPGDLVKIGISILLAQRLKKILNVN